MILSKAKPPANSVVKNITMNKPLEIPRRLDILEDMFVSDNLFLFPSYSEKAILVLQWEKDGFIHAGVTQDASFRGSVGCVRLQDKLRSKQQLNEFLSDYPNLPSSFDDCARLAYFEMDMGWIT